jgi:hypothetical protein
MVKSNVVAIIAMLSKKLNLPNYSKTKVQSFEVNIDKNSF